MMRKFSCKLFGPLILFPALWSCEQFLEVGLPDQEPRLVINTLLEPTDTLKVFLTESRSVLEGRDYDEFPIVSDAQVQLQTSGGEIFPMTFIDKSRPYEPNAYYYLSGFELKEHENYEIHAKRTGFESVVGRVQFPELVPIKNISYRNLGPSESSANFDLVEFALTFDDPPSRNFYELSGQYYGQSTSEDYSFYSGDLYPTPVNPAYESYSWFQSGIVFDDLLLTGEDSELVFTASIPRDVELEVAIRFSNVSESFIRYRQTVGLQNDTRGDILSQPVLVYSNIENGMGILQARNPNLRVLNMLLED
ncbi:DUF4249 domain-containing protein [Algoriphagus sp.]|uniref:DUF4249 domain-containing protein n=1 Tax=Algoriphagus sp. TaxID=1872435 RepID=UPI002639ACFE|nr:DUF4249 domain-containing protein [Algoriphagus sp.]